VGPIAERQVIGMAVYRPAAQLGQEYGAMETDRGKTRGKFTELVFDVKHDAWVIPQYSHGILLLVDSVADVGVPAVPVNFVNAEVLALNFTNTPTELDHSDGDTFQLTWSLDGVGNYSTAVTFASDDTDVATVNASGLIDTAGAGTATITVTSTANPNLTDTVTVTVVA
jgi:hypothetical protein